jgi:hypothetical protein
MTDPLSHNDVKNLAADQEPPCLSIFMTTFRIGSEALQNTIRLKNLLVEAEERLLPRLKHHSAVQQFLRPIGELLQDGRLWADVDAGLALFRSMERLQYWRLPEAFESVAFVGDCFYVKPLLPLVAPAGQYCLLAVSQNGVRLFEGNQRGLAEIQVANLPKSLVDALHLHPPEGLFEVRTAMTAIHGKEGAVFHGQGAATAHHKDDILAYFRIIDRALHDFLNDRRVPLVFVGVGYLFPIYKQANSYPYLLEQSIPGNPDYTNPLALHGRAIEILTPHWHRDENKDWKWFHQATGTDRVSSDLKEILPAAYQGRVDALFVAADVEPWGHFDPATGHFELTASQATGSESLLNSAACATLRAGGRVHAVKSANLPQGRLASALLRYSVAVPSA